MNDLKYRELWDKAEKLGEKAAESAYPESQPDLRKQYAKRAAIRHYEMMTLWMPK